MVAWDSALQRLCLFITGNTYVKQIWQTPNHGRVKNCVEVKTYVISYASLSISKYLTKVDLKKASKQFQLRKTQCYNFRFLSNVSFQRRQNSSEKNSFEIFQFPYFSKQEWLNSKTYEVVFKFYNVKVIGLVFCIYM